MLVSLSDDQIEELNLEIALKVFGLSESQFSLWPWEVPDFARDRNYAAGVAGRMWAFPLHREAFERNLLASVPKMHGGVSEWLIVCTPEDICKAAIKAICECGELKRPLPTDKNIHDPLGDV